jgi:hypothetical protein
MQTTARALARLVALTLSPGLSADEVIRTAKTLTARGSSRMLIVIMAIGSQN